MKSILAALLFLRLGGCRQYAGIDNFGGFDDPQFAIASRNPDASASAQFGNSQDFTLRLNSTRVNVPDATDSNGAPIEGAYIVATSLDITSPQDAGLNTEATESTANKTSNSGLLCAGIVSAAFPYSVLAGYDASRPGDCTGPFGKACAAAMLSAMTLSSSNSSSCPNPGAILDLEECKDVVRADEGLVSARSLRLSGFSNSTTPAYQEGEVMFGRQSLPLSASERAEGEAEKHRLKLAFITTLEYSPGGGGHSAVFPVCLTANPVKQSSNGTAGTSNSPGVAGPTAMAAVGAIAAAGLGFAMNMA
ncbi:uncharacterized protein LTR77_009228 [Saxophila tyrrhenica]|uniref:Lipoprotein n=1 Tax=Saxophila tyrrhenica TaxID=1690608 RepID=A0AAV9NYU6_9PEZI|nr:hypothetical protein LTR77_009228 [Saxophila tyrrhenica]